MRNILTICMGLFAFAAITACAHEGHHRFAKHPLPAPHIKRIAPPPAPCRQCFRQCRNFCKPGPIARRHKRSARRNFFAHDPGKRPHHVMGCFLSGWRKMMLREDDFARFSTLCRKIRFAKMDYRKTPNADTEKALHTAIKNMVEAQQTFEIQRAEKALARAKEAVKEKEEIIGRVLERMKKCPGKGENKENK